MAVSKQSEKFQEIWMMPRLIRKIFMKVRKAHLRCYVDIIVFIRLCLH